MVTKNLVVLVAAVLSCACMVNAFMDHDLTVHVPAGRVECFYQPINKEKSMEVEYQVIAGGDLDIDFRMANPDGKVLMAESKKNDAVHTFDDLQPGDYEVCFSNRFSRISSKTVFFEIILDADETDDEDEDWKSFVQPDEDYGDKLASMEEEMDSIKTNMAKTIQTQSLLRVFEAKDRSIVERNFERINTWSFIYVIVMFTTIFLQLTMIKSMFSDDKKVRT